jgi:hypothetical protein
MTMSEVLKSNSSISNNLQIQLDDLQYSPEFNIESVKMKNIKNNKNLSVKGKLAWVLRNIASSLDKKKNFAYTIKVHPSISQNEVVEGFTIGFSVMLKHINDLTNENIQMEIYKEKCVV